MTDSRDTHHDPAGCMRDLRAALSRPELQEFDHPNPPSEKAQAAAYRLALALGRCRLFCPLETAPADRLQPHVALAAAEVFQRRLQEWADDVRNLPLEWEQADDPGEATDLCLDLLRARMRGWAAWLAIEDAYQEELEHSDANISLQATIDRLLIALDQFDKQLQQQADLLSLAANTNLLDNWRDLLAPPYHEELPWWLDGTLEEAAHRVEERALASQPNESVGRRLRREVLDWLPRRHSFAAGEQHEFQYLPPIHFHSQDGSVRVRLEVPTECGEDEAVVATFEAGVPDAKTPVWLVSVPSEVDSEGRAKFPVRDLCAAARAPYMELGEARLLLVPQQS